MRYAMHLRFRGGRWGLVPVIRGRRSLRLLASFPRGTKFFMDDGLVIAAHPEHEPWRYDPKTDEWLVIRPCYTSDNPA